MKLFRPVTNRWFLLAVFAAMGSGCAGMNGARVAPPTGSLDMLMQPQIEVPGNPQAGADAAAGLGPASSTGPSIPAVIIPSGTGFSAPTASPPPPSNFSAPVITPALPNAPTFSAPQTAPPTGTPGRAIKSPDSGWTPISPKTSQRRTLRSDAVALLPAPPSTEGMIVRGQNPNWDQPRYTQNQLPPASVAPVQYQQPVYPQPGQQYAPGFTAPQQPYGGQVPVQAAPAPQGYPSNVQQLPAPPGVPQPGYAPQPGFAPQGQPQPQPQPQFMQPPRGNAFAPSFPWFQPPSNIAPTPDESFLQSRPTPIDVIVEETRTGRFMFGVGVNSDAGVTGQITIDERNFDIFNPPTSFDQFVDGTAWRGGGQGFRIEAQPGTQVQRYVVSFTEPYLLNLPVSMSTSGFYFDRGYTDWAESRLGGRLGFGYRLTPDLSVSLAGRAENVNIHSPRIVGVPLLDQAVGDNDIFSVKAAMTHDTRDLPFAPTQGHYIDVSYEQAFGEFNFGRVEAEYAQYFLMRERPDGSGRHTLAFTLKGGVTGPDTPIFENYFAGGFSTLRGFAFRGASPVENTVVVGGRMKLLASAEYFFPLTADDMIKGVVFCDFGTVERDIKIDTSNFRVAPGFGFRINVAALGPAPLAFDFAFPIAYADTDTRQVFSFYVGFARQ